ncbi:MAG: efflux RND transporter periplasmic adaptor subunit [Planctomycetota bacterium]
MKKRILLLLVLAAAIGAGIWWYTSSHSQAGAMTLYGTVELRQVDLPFNNTERVSAVLVEEGDRVHMGEVLAKLDGSRLEPMVAQADAQVKAQTAALDRLLNGSRPEEILEAEQQVNAQHQALLRLEHGSRPDEIAQAQAQRDAAQQAYDKLKNGSRPEEIAEARATCDAAHAAMALAQQTFARTDALFESSKGGAVSQQDLDTARAAVDTATAQYTAAQKALALVVAGPREEDIAQAKAQLDAASRAFALVKAGPREEDIAQAKAQLGALEQNLALVKAGPRKEDIAQAKAQLAAASDQADELHRQWDDLTLVSPVNGLVRSRILEVGEMSSPQKPAFTIALSSPKWVRAYVSEPDFDRVTMGEGAQVSVDSADGKTFDGWVGFISPVAEFTPRAVETVDLRTSLVYEVRVFVKDPTDQLKLGMPATVVLTGQVSSHAGEPTGVTEKSTPPSATPAPAPASTPAAATKSAPTSTPAAASAPPAGPQP